MTDMSTAAVLKALPAHKASLHLTHNQHLAYYQTVEEYLFDKGAGTAFDPEKWVSHEDYVAAVANNDLWELQWYPDTPIGSYTVYGSTLDSVLRAAGAE